MQVTLLSGTWPFLGYRSSNIHELPSLMKLKKKMLTMNNSYKRRLSQQDNHAGVNR